MKLVFAGTPEFARTALAALHDAGHEVALVLTQPDRPAGRGQQLQASPVKQWALAHGVPVAQPRSLRLDGRWPQDAQAVREDLLATQAQCMVVAAYGLILPPWVLDMPPLGCVNIHASLLPRWRGAAPIHRAIEAGDADTGITLMQMDAGLDTGDMLWVRRCPIPADATTATLHDTLAELGAQCAVQALAQPHSWVRTPQPAQGVSYAHKIEKAEATIDWSEPAELWARRLRAFDPFPGVSTTLPGGETLKLWAGHAQAWPAGQAPAAPGTVLQADAQGVRVACGQGMLVLTRLQRAGGKRLDAAAFLQGCPVQPGQRLGV